MKRLTVTMYTVTRLVFAVDMAIPVVLALETNIAILEWHFSSLSLFAYNVSAHRDSSSAERGDGEGTRPEKPPDPHTKTQRLLDDGIYIATNEIE